MNYRHAYHAGNFADVFKHIILTALIQSLLRKESAFCYLETHAGTGHYDLFSQAAQKSQEYQLGIAKVLAEQHPPALVNDFIHAVKKINLPNKLRYYPGSPSFARQFMRLQDKMILSELHPEEYEALKKLFRHDKQVAIHHQDGYQSLKAFLPPKERRGLVLIDPPYEKPDDFASMPKLLADTLKRWETGMYAIWYPIKNRAIVKRFYQETKKRISQPTLIAELLIYPEEVQLELAGSGMMIINPPWQIESQLATVLPWLWKVLSVGQQGSYFLGNL